MIDPKKMDLIIEVDDSIAKLVDHMSYLIEDCRKGEYLFKERFYEKQLKELTALRVEFLNIFKRER